MRLMCGEKLTNRKRTNESTSILGLREDFDIVGAVEIGMPRDLTDGIRKVLDVDIKGVVGSNRPHVE